MLLYLSATFRENSIQFNSKWFYYIPFGSCKAELHVVYIILKCITICNYTDIFNIVYIIIMHLK